MALKPVETNKGGDPYSSERISFVSPGDTVTGHLVDTVTLSKDGDNFKKYTLRTPEGNYISTLGSHQLDMAFAKVPLNSLVQVTYKGKKKIRGGKTVREFEVMNDPNDLIADGADAEIMSARA